MEVDCHYGYTFPDGPALQKTILAKPYGDAEEYLQELKKEAIARVNGFMSNASYSGSYRTAVEKAKADATTAIAQATDDAAIKAAIQQAEKTIDSQTTIFELEYQTDVDCVARGQIWTGGWAYGTDGTINTAKYIDSASILEPGKLYTNIRENGDGYVTGGDEVMSATSNDQEKYPMDGTTTMTQSGRTLVFTNGAGQYVAPTDADLNLIVGKGVADLLKDDDADYETYLHTTPGTIGGLLVGWSLTGTVYAVVDEQGSDVVTDLYIYVTGVEKADKNTVSTPTVTIKTTSDGAKTDFAAGETISVSLTATPNWGLNQGDTQTINWYEESNPTTSLGTGATYTATAAGKYFAVAEQSISGTSPLVKATSAKSNVIEITQGTEAAIASITATSSQGTVTSGDAIDKSKVTVIATDTLGHQTYLTQDQFTLDKETALYADSSSGTLTVTVTAGEATTTFDLTVTARSYNVTVPSNTVSLKAEKGASITVPFTIADGSSITSVAVTGTDGMTDTEHTAAVADVTAELNADKTSVTITIAMETVDAALAQADGDTYKVTVTGASEDGTSNSTLTITVNLTA